MPEKLLDYIQIPEISAIPEGTHKILPNGKCGNCKFPIRRTDKDDNNFLFYPVVGVREHKENKVYLLKCPKCKQYNIT